MDPSVQVLNPTIEVCLVVLPSQPINPGRRISLESKECGPKHWNTEMVEKRGEPLLPPLPCALSYALQRLGHACPVLCPARALLTRVPLGPGPWLHHLPSHLSPVVRRLHCYYGRVRLLASVHQRRRLLAFPLRTKIALRHWPNTRPPGSRAKSIRTCQGLRPRRAVRALALARPSVSPSAI